MNYNLMMIFTVAITLIFGLVLFLQKQAYRKQLLKMEKDAFQLKVTTEEEVNKRLWQRLEIDKMILLATIRQERKIPKEVDNEFFSWLKIFFFEKNDHSFDWEIFYQKIDEIYDDALSKIAQDYPKLSSGQRRFCCLLLAKFSNKEIAFITNIHPTSVSMKKLVMKRVLQVPKNEDLVNFIILNAQKRK